MFSDGGWSFGGTVCERSSTCIGTQQRTGVYIIILTVVVFNTLLHKTGDFIETQWRTHLVNMGVYLLCVMVRIVM